MIDKAFGIENKEQYFPRTRWLLDYGRQKVKTPLQPDSIMIYNDKVYVLDAKLYRLDAIQTSRISCLTVLI